jgi:hypothetical protein
MGSVYFFLKFQVDFEVGTFFFSDETFSSILKSVYECVSTYTQRIKSTFKTLKILGLQRKRTARHSHHIYQIMSAEYQTTKLWDTA